MVCGFVMIYPFWFFMNMSKNGCYLELCCIVNFILGCRFLSNVNH